MDQFLWQRAKCISITSRTNLQPNKGIWSKLTYFAIPLLGFFICCMFHGMYELWFGVRRTCLQVACSLVHLSDDIGVPSVSGIICSAIMCINVMSDFHILWMTIVRLWRDSPYLDVSPFKFIVRINVVMKMTFSVSGYERTWTEDSGVWVNVVWT